MQQHPIDSMMQNTMESIRSMVDVNTVVGAPVTGSQGTTIIPISKVEEWNTDSISVTKAEEYKENWKILDELVDE